MEPICDTCNEELQRIVAERKSVEARQKFQLAQEVAERPHALGGQRAEGAGAERAGAEGAGESGSRGIQRLQREQRDGKSAEGAEE